VGSKRTLIAVCGTALAVLALAPAIAGAATVSVSAGKLSIAGGEGPDDVYLYCQAGFIKVGLLPSLDPATGPASCDSIDAIDAALAGGDDILYLLEIGADDLGAFSGVSVTGGAGYDQVLGLQEGTPLRPDYNPRMVVDLGPKGDRVLAGSGDDVLVGGGGGDVIRGGFGRDLISGGSGNDTLTGGTHNDRVSGGPGNDVVEGGRGKDRVKGGPGRDQVSQTTVHD
jgi:Ca2+-binding RTX toxin-like protein